ncbi:MAG: hypothetical protein B9J98_00725 [Candidatus Terraquivivens tikiterensis]|uniref:Uncharacterized protein n=1 Tax=Candidatus Terraquivivens tikiterensis TaxID=1980982 RepID=A0A2R7YA31_9ARCH|nr:MAG: hypothetical protein B9J98_00725 [Candidatus Terraquivivens tikiterensis]
MKYVGVERRRKGQRLYYYAVHRERSSGELKVKKCYLGAEEYAYVGQMHAKEGLALKGLLDRGRAVDYLLSLLGYVERAELDREQASALVERLEEVTELLRKRLGKYHTFVVPAGQRTQP